MLFVEESIVKFKAMLRRVNMNKHFTVIIIIYLNSNIQSIKIQVQYRLSINHIFTKNRHVLKNIGDTCSKQAMTMVLNICNC